MCAVALRRPPVPVVSVANARRAAFLGFIKPCDPTLPESPPVGDELYEIKADGYGAQVHLHDGNVTAYSLAVKPPRLHLPPASPAPQVASLFSHSALRQQPIDSSAVMAKTSAGVMVVSVVVLLFRRES
jgi:hypothetical protein